MQSGRSSTNRSNRLYPIRHLVIQNLSGQPVKRSSQTPNQSANLPSEVIKQSIKLMNLPINPSSDQSNIHSIHQQPRKQSTSKPSDQNSQQTSQSAHQALINQSIFNASSPQFSPRQTAILGTGWCEKKAPSPPNAKLNRLLGFSQKASGAFFSHRLSSRRTPTLNSGGQGGGLFFCTDRSRVKSFSVKFISVLLYCDAPRRGISHAEHRCWVLISFSLGRLPHAGQVHPAI